jgi:aryl carrier-like protein
MSKSMNIASLEPTDIQNSNPTTTDAAIQAELREDLARLLAIALDELTPDANLFDVGLDSIRLMALLEQWRGKGYAADLIDLAETPTLAAWALKFKSNPA